LEPPQAAGVVSIDLTAEDLVQMIRGMVIPLVTEPDRALHLPHLVLDGIRV
jgi:hypothetical protein